MRLGLINSDSLLMDAVLIVPMIPGALLGPAILKRLNQRVFELLAILLTLAAAVRLVL